MIEDIDFEAQAMYRVTYISIRQLIDELVVILNDNHNSIEALDYGHVGDLTYVRSQLFDIKTFLLRDE